MQQDENLISYGNTMKRMLCQIEKDVGQNLGKTMEGQITRLKEHYNKCYPLSSDTGMFKN